MDSKQARPATEIEHLMTNLVSNPPRSLYEEPDGSGPSIDYVHDPRFDDPQSVHEILEALSDAEVDFDTIRSDDFHLPSRPLLDRKTEELLFLRMNLLLCLADRRIQGGAAGDEASFSGMLEEARSLRDHIIEANQRLVVSMASKFAKSGIPLADLISEGNLSLIKAVSLFNVGMGFRFSTYAANAILRNLSRYVQREKRRRISSSEYCELAYDDEFPEWLDAHPAKIIAEFLSELPPDRKSVV